MAGQLVHAFPGQGDFSPSALAAALPRVPGLRAAVREVFEAVDRAGAELGAVPLGPRLLGAAPPSGAELARELPGTQQLALYGAALAVHRVSPAPDALLAVSFGEIPALVAAGCLSVPDGARLAGRLGALLQSAPGALTVLRCGPERAARLAAVAPEVVVACVNDDQECVLAGPVTAITAAEQAARAAEVPVARLRLPFLAHHPALAGQSAEFEQYARTLRFTAPRLPVHSAVSGTTHTAATDLPRALADCLVRPAILPPVARAALRPRATVLEAGTGRALTDCLRRLLPGLRVRTPVAAASRRQPQH
ncbi:acyltransferase domain-containing protein [Kitasatospora sp. NPDC006697]|uniref:acyltransferase domain-containing protein n=1 Tax=Kitasatospora sp. NPDC006697 TaxID=3364020 RepID=UPI0036B8058F